VIPLHDFLVSGVRTPLVVLLAAVSCVLLIACVNIANLMLTRAAVRAREIGIRTALGASRGRIVRQLIAESVLLGLAGGAAGAALAVWIAKLLVARAPGADAILPAGTVPVDTTVFVFAFVMATAGRAHGRFRNILVSAEVALSLVLLVAAGLLFHSFSRLLSACCSSDPPRSHGGAPSGMNDQVFDERLCLR